MQLTAAVHMQLHALLSKLRGLRELCIDTGCVVPSALASLRQRCPHVSFVQPHWAGTGLRAADFPSGAFC